ncbi:MAG TPA: hypothetical protein VFA17_01255 [Thermoplasmata archaeon]|nr:hypothetical protein [Thermoplasmata archaeon]
MGTRSDAPAREPAGDVGEGTANATRRLERLPLSPEHVDAWTPHPGEAD